jgi:hypothetical protein
MDNKTWFWRKRSSEKTIVATNKFGISVKGIDEEVITEASFVQSQLNFYFSFPFPSVKTPL